MLTTVFSFGYFKYILDRRDVPVKLSIKESITYSAGGLLGRAMKEKKEDILSDGAKK